MVSPALAAFAFAQEEKASPADTALGDGFSSRSKLTGNWGGVRDTWAERGLSVDLDATYTFQGVASGGADGPLFERLSDEDDTGHTFSGDLRLELDTSKAGLRRGGFFNSRLEGRAGRSVLQRAGSVSAVDEDALFSNVVDRFDEETLALTELTFTQYFGEEVALFGGLLDTAEGVDHRAGTPAASSLGPVAPAARRAQEATRPARRPARRRGRRAADRLFAGERLAPTAHKPLFALFVLAIAPLGGC